MLLLAIAPLVVLALALLGGGTLAFLVASRKGEAAPPPGTMVLIGTVGDLDVEVRQQTSDSLQWFVFRQGVSQGSGAGTYDQNPIVNMLEFAVGLVPASAPITLTWTAEGAVGRQKDHGAVTLTAEPKNVQGGQVGQVGQVWHYTASDDKHGTFVSDDAPSRGAAVYKAEEAIGAHLGVVLEGAASPPEPEPGGGGGEPPVGGGGVTLPPGPGQEIAKEARGLKFVGCNVVAGSPFEWFPWAREQIIAAFENASGLPEPFDFYDATIAIAMDEAGVVGCEPLVEGEAPMEIGEQVATTIGGTPWGAVAAKIDALMLAIQDDMYLSIPPPDEIFAGLLGGFLVSNKGHKERYKGYAIVVRPQPNGTQRWWIFEGARLFDELADVEGVALTEPDAIAEARMRVDDLVGGVAPGDIVLPGGGAPEPGPGGIAPPGGVLQAEGSIGDVTISVRLVAGEHKWTIDSPAIAEKSGFKPTLQAAARAAMLAADVLADFGEAAEIIAADDSWWASTSVTAEGLWDWQRSDGTNSSAPTRKAAIEAMFGE